MNTEGVSNERLLMECEMSVNVESHAVVRLIELLIEVENRRLHAALAYSSMNDFCVRRLRLTENEAFRRLACARLIVKFPAILAPLRERKVTLTNVVLMRDLFNADNVEALLLEMEGKSKREVEAIVARLQPKPDVPDAVWTLGTQRELAAAPAAADASPMGAPAEQVIATARALSEDRHAFAFTGSTEFREKLEKARRLSARHPRGDSIAAVLESGLDLLIAEYEKRQLGKTTRPRKAKPSTDPTYVTAATRREVALRDEMQCTFVSAEGVRCIARERLELDHRQPRARGGAGDAANVRLLCAGHNRYEAEKAYGREHIDRSIHIAQARSSRSKLPKPFPGVTEKRAGLRYALAQDCGFKGHEVDRLLATMTSPATWERPLGTLIVESIAHLAKEAGSARAR